MASASAATALDATRPETWLEDGFEPLFAMSWRDYEDVQFAALRLRFEQLKESVAALQKLAKREGIPAIDSLDEALPLLFDHRVYKSYPLSLIENRDIARLNAWLGRLTTHDLSQADLAGVRTIDGWLDRLDEHGMLVGHSTGTTGKLSFVPRSRTEYPAWRKAFYEANRATTGVNGETDPIETFFPGYRGGHQMAMKMLGLFNIPAAGGEEHYHTLYQSYISSDLLSLAGRMQAAEDRGELERLGLEPELLKKREQLLAQAKRRDQDIEAFFFELFEEFRGRRVKIGGTFGDLIRIARNGIDKGLKPEFAPGSIISTGGGMKGASGGKGTGITDAPEDWEAFLRDYFGIETIGMVYGMSETTSTSPRCSAGHYHVMPQMIPLLFDAEMNLLPREGVQTGRFAFFDLNAQTYWGGFISGDRVTIDWDEDCRCGWKGPRIAQDISRFAEQAGGDDKITCAGTAQAYNEFMEFVAGDA
jgi:hypothetical protein